MKEKKDRSLSELSQDKEVQANLSRLMGNGLVKGQLKEYQGIWEAKPSGYPLDIAFVQKNPAGHDELTFLGLSVCGMDGVVGIKIDREGVGVAQALTDLELQPEIGRLEEEGASVLVLTPGQLSGWVSFYDQVLAGDLRESIGERVLEFSGLEWQTDMQTEEVNRDLSGLLEENWDYLSTLGVVDFAKKGGMDVMFVDGTGQGVAVPLFHLREPQMEGEIVGESVTEGGQDCAGIVVQRMGETDREVWVRALEIQERIQKKTKKQLRVVPVGVKQISLWEKMGMDSEWRAVEKRAKITAEDVVRFLYLGTDTLNPGVLAVPPYSFSLPGNGDRFSFPGVDVVFTRRDPETGAKRIASVDNWLVQDRQGKEVPLSNVAGIRIFPSGMSFEDMKKFADPIRKDFAHRAGLPGAYILNLTPELFARWLRDGSPFFNKDVQTVRASIEKQHEYFMPGKAEKAYYFQLRQKDEIGGNKNGLLLVDGEGNKVTHLFDVGLGFTDMPRGFNGIGQDPNTADGLLRLFRTGVLPMVPGWWEKEYIKQTALKMTGMAYANFIRDDKVAQFVASELIARCTKEELSALLPKNVLETLLRVGPDYKQKWWGRADRLVETATPTHPHADHISLMSYLSHDIRVILSGPTAGYFNAITQKAGSWRRRLTDRKMLTQPLVGGAYQTEQMNIESYFFSGQPVRLSSQVTLEPFFVTHSVPATWQMYNIKTRNGGSTNLFNSGDWNVSHDRRTMEMAERLKGKPDVIVMEGTNVGSEKAYMGRTEKDVRDTFLELVKNSPGEVIVAIAPTNNMARLRGLLEVAEATGRKLALSFPHAEMALQIAAAKELAPSGAEGFEDVLPYDVGNGPLTVWHKQMTAPRAYHKALVEIANRGELGVLDHERLSKENGKWIVVVSPFDVLEDQFDGIRITSSMKLVWMSSFPHDQSQRYFIGANNDWIRRSGKVKFVADMEIGGQGGSAKSRLYGNGVLHVSGHCTPQEMVAVTEILVGSDRKNIPVIINHSEAPEEAARLLVARLGDKITPISKLTRYDPNDPHAFPGFYYPLV